MKALFGLLLSLGVISTNTAFAGTGTIYNNASIGFTIYVSAMDDRISFCNYQDKCFDFDPVKGSTNLYKEVTGKCTLTMDYFDKNFAEGKTKNDFMLNLSAQVVQVIKGEDQCQLMQENLNQKRSLTGVYQ
jgi:hypothetical protein